MAGAAVAIAATGAAGIAIGYSTSSTAHASSDTPTPATSSQTMQAKLPSVGATDSASYRLFTVASPTAAAAKSIDIPGGAPGTLKPGTLRTITPTGLPSGARAWAGVGRHGPCVFVLPSPDGFVSGACDGVRSTQPPTVSVASEDGSSTVLVGLAPDSAPTAIFTTVDGQAHRVPTASNAFATVIKGRVDDSGVAVPTTAGN